ncbi:MAG: DUF3089 domain-containing protein [Bacteroidetes bacterium]|nr:MAG: DUF3089 domain-containing protein [Bacteroidota bacterium]
MRPHQAFAALDVPAAPDYSQDQFWAALPWTRDSADLTPSGFTDRQGQSAADVFYLHPTTYTPKRGWTKWNGSVRDTKLNTKTQATAIKFQATAFNGVGRVFAPFYRQAHLHAYYTKDTASAKRAFDLAYDDVRQAFRYYLANHNQGRPIVILSHSQGTTHAKRLLQEFFDGTDLQEQLVAAYVLGIAVKETDFDQLPPCETDSDLGCIISWRTFKRGYNPKRPAVPEVIVTNPLLWTTATTYAPDTLNRGAVLRPFERVIPHAVDAQVYQDILWASKPKFPGSWLLWTSNYHAGDVNLFYANLRYNAQERVQVFLEQR